MNREFSQNEKILGFLRLHGSITPMQALRKFQCYRLGARIYELKKRGNNISSDLIETRGGKTVARYTLIAG
jgi:hypothetical protein